MDIPGLTEEHVLKTVEIILSELTKVDIFFTLNGNLRKLYIEKILRGY